jgi:hypothetical protein
VSALNGPEKVALALHLMEQQADQLNSMIQAGQSNVEQDYLAAFSVSEPG